MSAPDEQRHSDQVGRGSQPPDEASIEQQEPAPLNVGEYEDDDELEGLDVATKVQALADTVEIPASLEQALQARLAVGARIVKLQDQRKDMQARRNLPDDVKRELRRQDREARDLPSADEARARQANLRERLKSGVKQREQQGPSLGKELAEAYRLATRQWELLIEREETGPALMRMAAEVVKSEPLYTLLRQCAIQADDLYGWAVAARLLESIQARETEALRGVRAALQENEASRSKGIRGLLSRRGEFKEAEARYQHDEAGHVAILAAVNDELRSLDRILSACFWRVYENAAALLVEDTDLDATQEAHLRACLRYGMIGASEWFLSPDFAEHLLQDAAQHRQGWDYAMSATHVLYADEYMEAIARGYITPSIDEDLELNQRHSEAWKADKAWRRIVFLKTREPALHELAKTLRVRAQSLREERAEAEAQRRKLVRSAPDYKRRYQDLSNQAQSARVEAARMDRAVAHINDRFLPELAEARDTARRRLAAAQAQITSESLVRKEARAIHRVSRLCAKLKDPFPAFSLRDNYRPQAGTINSREEILRALADIEARDTTIFKDPLLPVRKPSQRIHLRFSPVVLLAPACGFMGYAWNPRSRPERGRLVVPAYMLRPGLRERILHNLLADFRWDTSKASAGVDLMTSDTLVAAYATVRWEYRRKNRETREKAAIYSEENDRRNWRRHYALYLQSAHEGGKRLFHKCRECYEAAIKYLGLPEGVERLKR